jgi:hypothetical protein
MHHLLEESGPDAAPMPSIAGAQESPTPLRFFIVHDSSVNLSKHEMKIKDR